MSVTSRPGATTTPSALPATVVADLDGQVEVGPGQPQPVAADLEPDPRQHRQRAAPAGDGPAGGARGPRRRTSRSHRNFTALPSSTSLEI